LLDSALRGTPTARTPPNLRHPERMTPADSALPFRLVESLGRVAREHPTARKLLVSPTLGAGRELLRRLALTEGGWIGFEVTTPRPLAARVARGALAHTGLRPLDPFEQRALLDEALDSTLLARAGRMSDLAEGVGFRERVHEAVLALRLADVSPNAVERARLRDEEKRGFLAALLRRYERLLAERARTDTAGVLSLAVRVLEDGSAGLHGAATGADVVVLQPGLGARGFTGRLVSALAGRGARVLEGDPVVGRDVPPAVLWHRGVPVTAHAFLDAPTQVLPGMARPEIDVFRAGSVQDELREVLRRAAGRGLRWDEVEIVTPDPATYGSALHALSTRLGIPVTYAVGLPVERTRTGRVMGTYLEWISEGFQAAPIRRLLEAGDLRPPRSHGSIPPAVLARRFRALRIGWGRKRYRTRIREALEAVDQLPQGRREPDEAFERRRSRARNELRALRAVLFPALRSTPNVPDRSTDPGAPVSPSELARGLLAFLRRVPAERGPDRIAREEVVRVLDRIESTLLRRTHFRAAVAILRNHLDVRVRAALPGAAEDDVGAPWVSQGGCLHLSDLEHGGYNGRTAVFMVGLDADRLPGTGGQDPLLLDADRRVLGRALPTSAEVVKERAFRVSAFFARLRGPVTLSHAAWDAAEARALGPSPLLLQALRLGRGDDRLTFRDLEQALGRVVCAVPSGAYPPLDADDVWMAALGDGEVLRDGVAAVRRAFRGLDAGLAARSARAVGAPGPFHGVVTPRPDALDPRSNTDLTVSTSRLETLGSCPLRYFHGSVLGIRPPDDPMLDPDRWLDDRNRGSLLHRVFERTLRLAKERGMAAADAALEGLAVTELERAADALRDELPEPGEGTLRRELAALRDDVRSFVRMVRERGAPWVRLEWGFGMDEDDPVELSVGGRPVRLRGMIDRIDDLGIDGIHVVDYKTGVAREFAGRGAFNGGRRLQHALYALAVEARLGGQVVAGEYHFPTLRGEHEVFSFSRLQAAGVGSLLAHMLDGAAAGHFVPTDEPDDCRFCDYREICRVRDAGWGKIDSPMASWSRDRMTLDGSGAMTQLAQVRRFEE